MNLLSFLLLSLVVLIPFVNSTDVIQESSTQAFVRHFRETFQQIEFDKEAYIKVQTDVNFPNQGEWTIMYRFWTRYETQRVWASDLEIHRGQGQPIIYYQTLFKDGQLYLSKKENVTLPTEIAFMRNVLFKGPRFHSIISDYLQEENGSEQLAILNLEEFGQAVQVFSKKFVSPFDGTDHLLKIARVNVDNYMIADCFGNDTDTMFFDANIRRKPFTKYDDNVLQVSWYMHPHQERTDYPEIIESPSGMFLGLRDLIGSDN